MCDLIEGLRAEALRLSRQSLDSQDAGIASILAERAADAIEAQAAALQNILNGIETGVITVTTDQDETWENAIQQARSAMIAIDKAAPDPASSSPR